MKRPYFLCYKKYILGRVAKKDHFSCYKIFKDANYFKSVSDNQ